AFADLGDSGAIVVDENRKAIGILFSIGPFSPLGSNKFPAYASHILPVLRSLEVCIETSGGTAPCSCAATDGTGTAPARPKQAQLPAPDGRFHFTAPRASPEPIHITDDERSRMLLLRDALRETAYGIELHDTFAEIRRE